MGHYTRVGAALICGLLSACGANTAAPPVPDAPAVHTSLSSKIQHVIIIVQENRSFDNLFAGYPGADTQSYGYTATGKKVTLKAITSS